VSSPKITHKTGSSLDIPFKIVSSPKITHKTSSRVVIKLKTCSRVEINKSAPRNSFYIFHPPSSLCLSYLPIDSDFIMQGMLRMQVWFDHTAGATIVNTRPNQSVNRVECRKMTKTCSIYVLLNLFYLCFS